MHPVTRSGNSALDGLISIGAIVCLLLAGGTVLGLANRKHFSFGWLVTAAALVFINDLLLTNGYGLIPDMLPASDWNWQGKILALVGTLAIASLPGFGWKRTGLTLVQSEGSLKSCIPGALLYCLFFLAIGLAFPSDAASAETVAFQLTMPSLEEEAFYRGILLLALYEAFTRGANRFGVEWRWGALASCLLFGLAHAFAYTDGAFAFDPIYMALTAIPSFLAVWMRLRTGSILLPIVLHSFGNSISLLL
ncbi:CPBP family intramembrane glutamic endopeptidase, BDIM_20840 family [Blastomonas sp.]|uniref:CPBP family intramembrane glutamic endopeptidase, BDIM_20840 family n=1 Tax=Blastomonas sp. TaxID=1909299 RepID=UPI00391A4DD0